MSLFLKMACLITWGNTTQTFSELKHLAAHLMLYGRLTLLKIITSKRSEFFELWFEVRYVILTWRCNILLWHFTSHSCPGKQLSNAWQLSGGGTGLRGIFQWCLYHFTIFFILKVSHMICLRLKYRIKCFNNRQNYLSWLFMPPKEHRDAHCTCPRGASVRLPCVFKSTWSSF